PAQDLLEEPDALLDLADANPYPRIDVAILADRNIEVEFPVRSVADVTARIEGTAGRAADIPAGAKAACQGGLQNSGGDGAILERGGVVVKLHQLGQADGDFRKQVFHM